MPAKPPTLQQLREAYLAHVALELLFLALPILSKRRPGLARHLARETDCDPAARLEDALAAMKKRGVAPSLAKAISEVWRQAGATFDWLAGQARQTPPCLALATQDALRLTRHEIDALRREVASGGFGPGRSKGRHPPRFPETYAILLGALRAFQRSRDPKQFLEPIQSRLPKKSADAIAAMSPEDLTDLLNQTPHKAAIDLIQHRIRGIQGIRGKTRGETYVERLLYTPDPEDHLGADQPPTDEAPPLTHDTIRDWIRHPHGKK